MHSSTVLRKTPSYVTLEEIPLEYIYKNNAFNNMVII